MVITLSTAFGPSILPAPSPRASSRDITGARLISIRKCRRGSRRRNLVDICSNGQSVTRCRPDYADSHNIAGFQYGIGLPGEFRSHSNWRTPQQGGENRGAHYHGRYEWYTVDDCRALRGWGV